MKKRGLNSTLAAGERYMLNPLHQETLLDAIYNIICGKLRFRLRLNDPVYELHDLIFGLTWSDCHARSTDVCGSCRKQVKRHKSISHRPTFRLTIILKMHQTRSFLHCYRLPQRTSDVSSRFPGCCRPNQAMCRQKKLTEFLFRVPKAV